MSEKNNGATRFIENDVDLCVGPCILANMSQSLTIEESLLIRLRKEAKKQGRSISNLVNFWVREELAKSK